MTTSATSQSASISPRLGSNEAVERLDDVVMNMLQQADLNGHDMLDHDDDQDVMHFQYQKSDTDRKEQNLLQTTTKRYSSSSYGGMDSSKLSSSGARPQSNSNGSRNNNGLLSTSSYEMSSSSAGVRTSTTVKSTTQQKMVISKGNVVRIHVPYGQELTHEVRVVPSPGNEGIKVTTGGEIPPSAQHQPTRPSGTSSMKRDKEKSRHGGRSGGGSPNKRLSAPR